MNWRPLLAMIAALVAVHAAEPAADKDQPAAKPAAAQAWQALCDGKSLAGWKAADFAGAGEVTVADGELRIGRGEPATGIVRDGEPPARMNYEIELEAMRTSGGDFFCGLTFPVGKDPCTLVCGGWGGSLVGLSSIDGLDASENQTTTVREFKDKTWYKIRLRVTTTAITAWIDDQEVLTQELAEHKISIRREVQPCVPLGISTWNTGSALRNFRLRKLDNLKPGVPAAHTNRMIEGWTVRVDDRLLKGDGAALGERALKLLTARLVAITTVMPEKSLAGLRAVTIELDLDYPGLTFMQYHPDADWLKQHGYSEALAKCVHIPDVADFLSPFENHRMPWVVLHELAHGYHHQVLGYDEPRIKAAWQKLRDSGKYQSVITNRWGMHEHYALTSPMEFFAEMTESYFGSNDFYPFVAGELQQAEPEVFALMAEIWGPLPQPKPRKASNK